MRQITFGNKKIFYRAEGNGDAVILLHGFAEDNRIWNYQAEKLRERFYVIIPDLPGSGASEMLDGDASIEDYAEVIKAIADAEINKNERKTFTLIGHSMGGYITLAFAEKYPELLNSFGLFHSSAFADDEAKKDARRKGIEFIKENGPASFLKTTTPNLFSEKTKKNNNNLIDDLIDLSKNFSAETLIQYYGAMMKRPERISVLKSFSKPVLFIIGKEDAAIPPDASLKQCHLPRISTVYILETSGHMGMWEQPRTSLDFLLKFLTQPR